MAEKILPLYPSPPIKINRVQPSGSLERPPLARGRFRVGRRAPQLHRLRRAFCDRRRAPSSTSTAAGILSLSLSHSLSLSPPATSIAGLPDLSPSGTHSRHRSLPGDRLPSRRPPTSASRHPRLPRSDHPPPLAQVFLLRLLEGPLATVDMQASDRFNINSQLEHLQAKYVGTGHADLNRFEWAVNIQRDSYASYVGHYPIMAYFALAENESIGRERYNFMQNSMYTV
ncbi:hypothetical protein Taro_039300 [Colocasia esculenta]|uniref:Splicing factor subunit n=1 Tax=Colocasia esculenta TaxID=4460 RepID=A0A843WIG4_COLES|nr:hypothetical protein [Colocasia esculenta]